MGTRIAVLALMGAAFVMSAGADQPVPRPSPAFTIKKVGPLTQYRGKIVVLAFVHTTCPHCQNLTKVFTPLAKEYALRGVQFVECAFNTNAENLIGQFVQVLQPSFPVGWSDDPAVKAYLGYKPDDNFYVPHLIIIDRRGVIRGDYAGESTFMLDPGNNVRAELEKLLRASGPSSSSGTKKTVAKTK